MSKLIALCLATMMILTGCKKEEPTTANTPTPINTDNKDNLDHFRIVWVPIDEESKVRCIIWQNTTGYDYGGISCDWDFAVRN